MRVADLGWSQPSLFDLSPDRQIHSAPLGGLLTAFLAGQVCYIHGNNASQDCGDQGDT